MILNINFRIEKKKPCYQQFEYSFFYFLHYLNSIFFLATTINPKLC